MTDPNVIEAMNLLSAAVCSLATKGLSHKPSDAQHAIDLADEASELLAAAEKPAEAAPVAPKLPWEVRRRDGSRVIARCEDASLAHMVLDGLQHTDLFEVAAAPPVAAVRFDAKGDAAGPGWEAESFALESPRRVSVTVDLRPGEDAGETTATILAACGRGP